MKISEIKSALKEKNNVELIAIIGDLIKLNKKNKEAIIYYLNSKDVEFQLEKSKKELANIFSTVNSNWYFAKKTIAKAVRFTVEQCKIVNNTELEIALWLYFLNLYKQLPFNGKAGYPVITTAYENAIAKVEKKLITLHEDLQYDYRKLLDAAIS